MLGPPTELRRLLIVVEYGILNGGERSLLSVLPELVRMGWQPTVCAPDDSEFACALSAISIPVTGWHMYDSNGTRHSQSRLRDQLADLCQNFQPALVHGNSLSMTRLIGPVTRALKIPSVGHIRDIVKLSRQAISDINCIDKLIAVSQATADWHSAQGIQADKLKVVYNGVDLETFHSLSLRPDSRSHAAVGNLAVSTIRDELGIPPAAPVVLFVGQIGMRKGVDLLIESFQEIIQRHPDSHLLIVGERNSNKPEAVEFEQRIRQNSEQISGSTTCSTHLHWLGRRTDVAAIMRASTLLLHPARQEPLGRVLLEAAATGLPMVTTNVGGSAEILATLEGFHLLQPIDAAALTKRSCELLSDSPQRGQLSEALRNRAVRFFSSQQTANRINQIYRQTIIRYGDQQ